MDKDYDKQCAMAALNAVMKWHGWGSPVGLSVFLLSLSLSALIIYRTFFS